MLEFPSFSDYQKRYPNKFHLNILNGLTSVITSHEFSKYEEVKCGGFIFSKNEITSEEFLKLVNAFWFLLDDTFQCSFIWLMKCCNCSSHLLIAPNIRSYIEQLSKTNINDRRRDYYFLDIKELAWAVASSLMKKDISEWKEFINATNLEQRFARREPAFSIEIALKEISKEDPEWIKDKLRPFIQKDKEFWLRACAYKQIINSGVFDLEVVEELRKDVSMTVTKQAAEELLKSEKLYDNFDDLINKLLKCQHRDLNVQLAQKLPKEKLPFLMGSKHQEVKEIIQQRLSG